MPKGKGYKARGLKTKVARGVRRGKSRRKK